MGQVVQLSDYRETLLEESEFVCSDSRVPIEFALGYDNRDECIAKIAEYGVRSRQIRMVNEEPAALLYLISVRDAIWLNKKILEQEEIGDEEIAQRIDLIQMLENINLPMMDSMWESFTRAGNH